MTLMRVAPLFICLACPAVAQETRQLDAHEHGVGQLNIAFDGSQIAMELKAPGADIVGFEYIPSSDEDKASVETALASLSKPLDLFPLSAAAGCTLVKATAELESEEDHDEHDHNKHEDDHDDHAEHDEKHDDHDHEKHEEDHDDHNDDHVEHDHDKHEDGHDDHDHAAEKAMHTEFHAEYLLNCADPAAATSMAFAAYFEMFPNAKEVEVQVISNAGATAFDVTREASTLVLSGI